MRADATDSPYLYVLRRMSLTFGALVPVLLMLMATNVIGLHGVIVATAVGLIMYASAAWFGRPPRISGEKPNAPVSGLSR